MQRRAVLTGLAALPAVPAFAQSAAPGVVTIHMTTGQGLLVLELAGDKAPLTVANFLRYVDAGRYDRATIYRALQVKGAPQLGLVQGGARPGRPIPPVAHEPTTQTGLRHVDGTISLARGEPGSGTSDFFICLGDAAYLDAKPDAPGDNLGYAAFGRVVEGMDIVRHIHTLPKSDTAENPVMVGQMLVDPVPIISTKRA